MRTSIALLLVIAAVPLHAGMPVLSAADACLQLEAKGRALTTEPVRCEAVTAGLILRDLSDKGLKLIQEKLFIDKHYLGHAIVPAPVTQVPLAAGPSKQVAALQALQLEAALERLKDSPAMAQAVTANFDNSMVRSDLFVQVQGGPPGSGGDQNRGGQDRNGPPGSGGDQDRSGPPGSGNPPRQDPPTSTPPSRPAPVWRSNFPAPRPNWWNTDFDHYDWWNTLPSGYSRPRTEKRGENTFFYYSGWSRWSNDFVTSWERTEDTATINRTAANQGQIHSRSLTSQVYRESKTCYYQAVYRYDWSQGGFNGSHWEERFDHYAARCIRQPREYGQPRVYTVHASFDMSLVSGQDLPWESDVIRLRYDGRNQPRYDFSSAAYKYSSRLDDQRSGSESVTLTAGDKILRAPESDKVQAFLRINAGKVEFVINDDRASYYQGETLRVDAKIVRRVVIKVKGRFWGWNEKNVDTIIHGSPLDILVDANTPQTITDLTGAASAAKPANAVRSSVFIESWQFSRINSRISTGGAIRRGKGNSIAN